MQARTASDSPRRGKGGRGAYLFPGCRTNAPQVITASRRSPIQFPTSRKWWIGEDANKIQGHRDTSAVLERGALDNGTADNSSHWLAGAKPSRLMSEMPLTTVWLILTTPRSPGK